MANFNVDFNVSSLSTVEKLELIREILYCPDVGSADIADLLNETFTTATLSLIAERLNKYVSASSK